MILKIQLAGNGLLIPLQYQSLIQGYIYHTLKQSENYKQLHDEGYGEANQKFFVFSRLMGAYQKEGLNLSFPGVVTLWIGSADVNLLLLIVARLSAEKCILLGNQKIEVMSYQMTNLGSEVTWCHVKTVAPITLYITNPDRSVRYYRPDEKEFTELLVSNAYKKYANWYSVEPSQPLQINVNGPFKKTVVKFKNTTYEAYDVELEMTGSPKMLALLVNSGLGPKNSAGFGMVKVLNEKDTIPS